jgi:hypothetical protein
MSELDAEELARVRDRAKDRTSRLCNIWLARNDQSGMLLRRWAKLEADLGRRRRWYELTPETQAAIPEGEELKRLDAAMDVVNAKRDHLTRKLIVAAAVTPEAVILKLAVAAELVSPEDNQASHRLICSLLRDLTAVQDLRDTPDHPRQGRG